MGEEEGRTCLETRNELGCVCADHCLPEAQARFILNHLRKGRRCSATPETPRLCLCQPGPADSTVRCDCCVSPDCCVPWLLLLHS